MGARTRLSRLGGGSKGEPYFSELEPDALEVDVYNQSTVSAAGETMEDEAWHDFSRLSPWKMYKTHGRSDNLPIGLGLFLPVVKLAFLYKRRATIQIF